MTDIRDNTTVGEAFAAAVAAYPDRPFLAVPANEARSYAAHGFELSYAQAGARVEELIGIYRQAGYGAGHRVAMLLESRPDHILHKLALNTIGACCIPINPDYRSGETAYLIEHSEPILILSLASRMAQIRQALAESAYQPPVVAVEAFAQTLPACQSPACSGSPVPATPASILYTSGTTGRPKGCILSNGYEVASGAWYAALGGLATLRPGTERIYNPLPLYHVNASVVSLMAAIVSGNCQIQADRFNSERWWDEVRESRATVVHHLGVIVSMLLNRPQVESDREHSVRFGFGAGVEPQLHRTFEERFGFPLIEIWGMTEMVRVLADHLPPRRVGTRAIGRAMPGLEVRVVDENDQDVAEDEPGEMLVRHSAATPRRGCFSGYLNDPAATEAAWRGGWLHTGDVVWRGEDGMIHFLDRRKNIIRRSGENIAAAEVEALLLAHPDVQQAAVLPVKDEMREEEVLACVVLKGDVPRAGAAERLFTFCQERLAYFKLPGWIHLLDALPTTGTQKIQKHNIYPAGTDPRSVPGVLDLRSRKKRTRD